MTIAQLQAVVEAIDPASTITRDNVESVLDLFIALEFLSNPFNHRPLVQRGREILRKFGQQIYDETHSEDVMQITFYSFSNDKKYRQSVEMIMLVRSSLEDAWDGIGEWRV